MNQQREVIYSLRRFALEGGEELKGEALKMVEQGDRRAASRRRSPSTTEQRVGLRPAAAGSADALPARVPEFEDGPPTDEAGEPIAAARRRSGRTLAASRRAFAAKIASLDGYSDALLSLVMLNVLDEKWKDHLYDLDQLRNAIHYRSWGQKDPLVEYKQEAYTMFVDLMNDIYNTFSRTLSAGAARDRTAARPAGGPDDRRMASRSAGPAPQPRRGGTTRSASSRTLSPTATVRDRRRRDSRWRRGHRTGRAAGRQAGRREEGSAHRRRRAALDQSRPRRPRETSTGRPSGATIPARAARARSSRSATERPSSARSRTPMW